MSYSSFAKPASQSAAADNAIYCDVCQIPFKSEQVCMHLFIGKLI